MAMHHCMTHPCPVCMRPAPVPVAAVAGIFADAPEPTHCDECGQALPKPKHEARPPSPLTMIGRGAK